MLYSTTGYKLGRLAWLSEESDTETSELARHMAPRALSGDCAALSQNFLT